MSRSLAALTRSWRIAAIRTPLPLSPTPTAPAFASLSPMVVRETRAQSLGSSVILRSFSSHDSTAAPYSRLAAVFPAAQITVQDVSGGCGTSFAIVLVDADLAKLPKLQGQRAVYKALGGLMESIHAVQVQISAPTES
mmetsp:Transcript_11254/g.35715  ORF Transcript_11254/g.35715 Transcript_11254/m.35715 type:complete len:138 (-) Transcript_11254:42-455(-)